MTFAFFDYFNAICLENHRMEVCTKNDTNKRRNKTNNYLSGIYF